MKEVKDKEKMDGMWGKNSRCKLCIFTLSFFSKLSGSQRTDYSNSKFDLLVYENQGMYFRHLNSNPTNMGWNHFQNSEECVICSRWFVTDFRGRKLKTRSWIKQKVICQCRLFPRGLRCFVLYLHIWQLGFRTKVKLALKYRSWEWEHELLGKKIKMCTLTAQLQSAQSYINWNNPCIPIPLS